MRTAFVLALLLLQPPRYLAAQTVGCADGVLQNPRAWFFDRISRQEGQAANDWPSVLRGSGLGAGPGPGQVPGVANYGITQQLDSGGNPRARLFLPTARPDGNGYYTHEVDTVSGEPGQQTWHWTDRGGNAYAPRPCDGSAPPPPPPPPQPSPVLTGRVDALEQHNEFIAGEIARLEDAINATRDLLIEQAGRVTTLESRKVPVRCSASIRAGVTMIPLSCRLD